jgi:hypothetical protein
MVNDPFNVLLNSVFWFLLRIFASAFTGEAELSFSSNLILVLGQCWLCKLNLEVLAHHPFLKRVWE